MTPSERAVIAIGAVAAASGPPAEEEDDYTLIVDLITDLLHLAVDHALNVDDILSAARLHITAERPR